MLSFFPPYRHPPSDHTTHKTSNVNYLQNYICLVVLQREVKWPHSARILVMFENIGHKLGLVAFSLTIEKRIYKHPRHILCLHIFFLYVKESFSFLRLSAIQHIQFQRICIVKGLSPEGCMKYVLVSSIIYLQQNTRQQEANV